MNANSWGELFRVTTFGESHGPALGAVIDGCPAGVPFDEGLLRGELARRRPGHGPGVSARQEQDEPEILSGVYQGRTLGTPIAILIRNRDQRPEDYAGIEAAPRPGHADDLWPAKFGHADLRGGGRSSGRETAARVAAGAVAAMAGRVLAPALAVTARPLRIGPLDLSTREPWLDEELLGLLAEAARSGESHGGLVELRAAGVPAGLGQPVFHKLKADLASAMLGIGACAGVEFGAGFHAAGQPGSSLHGASADPERYGGIRGGISTGEPLLLRLVFKPPATVGARALRGRHDPTVVLRALPVVEAMAWLTLIDHLLWTRLDRDVPALCT